MSRFVKGVVSVLPSLRAFQLRLATSDAPMETEVSRSAGVRNPSSQTSSDPGAGRRDRHLSLCPLRLADSPRPSLGSRPHRRSPRLPRPEPPLQEGLPSRREPRDGGSTAAAGAAAPIAGVVMRHSSTTVLVWGEQESAT